MNVKVTILPVINNMIEIVILQRKIIQYLFKASYVFWRKSVIVLYAKNLKKSKTNKPKHIPIYHNH